MFEPVLGYRLEVWVDEERDEGGVDVGEVIFLDCIDSML